MNITGILRDKKFRADYPGMIECIRLFFPALPRKKMEKAVPFQQIHPIRHDLSRLENERINR
jgi:hypothetical protein